MSDLLAEARMSRSMPSPALARAIRRDACVTQQRIADELGVHWTTVARWERGERVPRGQMRVRYAGLLRALQEQTP